MEFFRPRGVEITRVHFKVWETLKSGQGGDSVCTGNFTIVTAQMMGFDFSRFEKSWKLRNEGGQKSNNDVIESKRTSYTVNFNFNAQFENQILENKCVKTGIF